jgi:erythromycin esterase-like protein
MNTDRTQSEAALERARKRREWLDEQAREIEAMKSELAAEHGVPRDAKFEKAWNAAWSFGHSSGFSEVERYFNEIVELIKP